MNAVLSWYSPYTAQGQYQLPSGYLPTSPNLVKILLWQAWTEADHPQRIPHGPRCDSRWWRWIGINHHKPSHSLLSLWSHCFPGIVYRCVPHLFLIFLKYSIFHTIDKEDIFRIGKSQTKVGDGNEVRECSESKKEVPSWGMHGQLSPLVTL